MNTMNDSSCLCLLAACAIADLGAAVKLMATRLHSLHWFHLAPPLGEELKVFVPSHSICSFLRDLGSGHAQPRFLPDASLASLRVFADLSLPDTSSSCIILRSSSCCRPVCLPQFAVSLCVLPLSPPLVKASEP